MNQTDLKKIEHPRLGPSKPGALHQLNSRQQSLAAIEPASNQTC
jgi:hypothetical protein